MNVDDWAGRLSELALSEGFTVAVAESLTAGRLSAALGAAQESSRWFRGGIVAYSADVKHRLLRVPDVPVVSRTAAQVMAEGVRDLLEVDFAAAVTGVGGPGSEDGEPAGSVWFAIAAEHRTAVWHRHFHGDPASVLEQTIEFAGCRLVSVASAADDA
ncbi:CinA family protein [Nocardia aurantia]|uniref:CinA C-terminal domain-containing protein n=1 Tax=Nocardia aurantia TaxID=2585199 RepID=A0A7K0DSY5_9NOCA|nr:CinA family protein [Nocardia aurantia]MQY28883.1 hypothetical protein [Nocardia aurantia]